MVARRQALRFALLVLALVALVALFGWFDTLEPAPDRHHYPGEDELGAEYDAYVDERVAVAGTIVATDPPVLEVDHAHGTSRYELGNAPAVDEGQRVRVYATVRPGYELAVHEAIVTDGWERLYTYGVSILAALWVAGRAARRWRFDRDRLGFVPRTDSAPPTAAGEAPGAPAAGGEPDG